MHFYNVVYYTNVNKDCDKKTWKIYLFAVNNSAELMSCKIRLTAVQVLPLKFYSRSSEPLLADENRKNKLLLLTYF